MENIKIKKFNFTWFIPRKPKLKLINFINEISKEKLTANAKTLVEKWFNFEVAGLENVPEEGRALLTMNHRSMFDPFILVEVDREIIFIAGSKLWGDPVFAPVLDKYNCIKVNKKNPGISFYKEVLRRLNGEYIVGLYPEGTRNGFRKKKKYEDGVGTFAVKCDAPVIPAYIYYKYKIFGLLIPHITKVKIAIGQPYTIDKENIKGSGKIAMDHIFALKEQAKQLVKKR